MSVENYCSFVNITRNRLSKGKQELLNNPVLEVSLAFSPFLGRMIEVTSIPAFYLTHKFITSTPYIDWRLASTGIIAASILTMSLTEYYAIRRKKYCNNIYTNILNLACDNPLLGIIGSKAWSFVNILNPVHPFTAGMVSYAAVTDDWETFLNFMATGNIVKTIFNSGIDLMIATDRLNPLYNKVQQGKTRVGSLISKLRSRW